MDGVLDITDDLDVYVEEDNNNNVDAKEEEDNNMDVLCVQTFHNDKFGENADKCRHCAKVFLCRRSLKIHMVTTHWRKAFCM